MDRRGTWSGSRPRRARSGRCWRASLGSGLSTGCRCVHRKSGVRMSFESRSRIAVRFGHRIPTMQSQSSSLQSPPAPAWISGTGPVSCISDRQERTGSGVLHADEVVKTRGRGDRSKARGSDIGETTGTAPPPAQCKRSPPKSASPITPSSTGPGPTMRSASTPSPPPPRGFFCAS